MKAIMPYKEFYMTEAERRAVSVHTIFRGIARGEYVGLVLSKQKTHKQVLQLPAKLPPAQRAIFPGVPMRAFCRAEADRWNLSPHSIFYRIYRGMYVGIKILKIHRTRANIIQPGVFTPKFRAMCRPRTKIHLAHSKHL